MLLLFTKKEAFDWLAQGKKTIDIRKGNPKSADIAVFQSGRRSLRFKIVKKESGLLSEVLRLDNYKLVVPSAFDLCDAVKYLHTLYDVCDGIFTAYYVLPINST